LTISIASIVFRRLLVATTNFAQRFAVLVTVMALLLTVVAAVFFVRNFSMNMTTEEMLSDQLPFRQLARELDRELPQRSGLVVVVEGRTPEQADDAAAALAARLALKPKLFHSVSYLEGNDFFRRNGLLFLKLDALEALSDRLARAQPFLGALWRDPSLRGLFGMLELGARQTSEADQDPPVEIAPVLDEIAAVATAQVEGRPAELSWRRLMGGAATEERLRRIILVRPELNPGALRPAEEAINSLRQIASTLELHEDKGVRVRLTGPVAINHDELGAVTVGMGISSALSIALVIMLLIICFRSPRQTLSCLITLVVGLVVTAALGIAMVGTLNLMSVAFAVLFIGLGVDFGIHYALRFREYREKLPGHAESLAESAISVGGALALTAIAASISFFSFLPTNYVGLAELGLIAGCGMFIALIFTYVLMPALMTLVKPQFRHPVSWETPRRAAFTLWMRRHASLVTGIAVLLGVAGLAIAPQARFDFDPLHLKDEDTESVSTLLDLLEDDPTTAYAITLLADNLTEAAELTEKAATIDGVHSTRTVLSFVPTNQDEKLDIIADLAFLIEPALTAPQMDAPSSAEVIAAYESLRDSLKEMAARFDEETGQAAARLVMALDALIRQSGLNADVLDDLHFRLLGRLPREMVDLRRSLQAEPVTLETLPAALRDQWIAADGRLRVDIFPKENLYAGNDAIRRFVTAVQDVAPNAAGAPVSIYEAGRTVMGAFVQAAVLAGIAIAVMLLALLRSIKHTLLIFAPLALAAIFTVAAAVLIGMPFNFANVIVLPLLFGLGVAGSLQIVIRERKVGGEAGSLSTSTPRAVTFSALTTIASFGSLGLSSHPGISSMGVLLAIAIASSVACNLFVLPAILVLTDSRGTRTDPIL
jgi:hypothetical protein